MKNQADKKPSSFFKTPLIAPVAVMSLMGPMAMADFAETEPQAPVTSESDTELDLLVAPGWQVHQEGEEIQLNLATGSVDGVVYEASGLPAGLALDAETGIISGTIDQLAPLRSQTLVTARSAIRRESISFTWFVLENEVPQVEDPGVMISQSGEEVSWGMVAVDDDGEALSYKAYNLPKGLLMDGATGMVTGTIEAHDLLTTYHVTVQAKDDKVVGGRSYSWVVIPVR